MSYVEKYTDAQYLNLLRGSTQTSLSYPLNGLPDQAGLRLPNSI